MSTKLQKKKKKKKKKNVYPWGYLPLVLGICISVKLWNSKTSSSLKPYDQFSPDYTLGPFIEEVLIFFVQNNSAPLNKMAIMPKYGKNTKKSSQEPTKLRDHILVYRIEVSRSTKLVKKYDPRLPFDPFTWSNLRPYTFVCKKKKNEKSFFFFKLY